MSSTSSSSFYVPQKGTLGKALAAPPATSKLFSPFKIRDIEFPNRVFVSPMCMYSCQDGMATDFHLVHIGQFALKGYALIMMESTAVCPEGRISPNDLGLWDDAHVGPLKRITDFVHSLGGKIGVQLSHAGRKASTYPPYLAPTQRGWIPPSEGGWNVVGPSPVPYSSIHGVPQPIEDPSSLPHLFVLAAQRAEKAGFDVIELHAAHGYLLHSFLSPLTNLRDDAYGGTLPHRAHLVVSLVKLLRQQLSPSTLLFIRFSCTDWMATSSWTIEEVKQVVGWIQEDVDAIDCSSGMLHPDQTMVDTHPGFQVPFAQTIKHTFPLPTIAVGRITDPVQANTILLNEAADFIMMAREMLRDNWLYRASKVLNTPIRLPVQYERAKEELPNSAS